MAHPSIRTNPEVQQLCQCQCGRAVAGGRRPPSPGVVDRQSVADAKIHDAKQC
jgi:hypothetical protein